MNRKLDDYESGRDLVVETCDLLRLARIKAGLEQDEMAEVLGVSSSTISNWETGRTTPKPPFINAWAQITGYNTASLIGAGVAGTSKRDKSGADTSTNGTVSQLPRLDSNQEPSDWKLSPKHSTIREHCVTGEDPPPIVCPDVEAKDNQPPIGLSTAVCWSGGTDWNTLKVAGQR
jgi:transcriptional regulator with XRE-family HTH domain